MLTYMLFWRDNLSFLFPLFGFPENVVKAVEKLEARELQVFGLVCDGSNSQQRKNLIEKTIQEFSDVLFPWRGVGQIKCLFTSRFLLLWGDYRFVCRNMGRLMSNAAAHRSIDSILESKEPVLHKSWELKVKASVRAGSAPLKIWQQPRPFWLLMMLLT